MSARSKAIQKALAEARGAIVLGRSHVVVLGDREVVRQLPEMLTAKLRGEIDAVTVRLAGRQETVADCLQAAIQESRRFAAERGEVRKGRSRLALLVPDALSIPAASLRSLHDLSSRLGAHRLVLLVDHDVPHVDDPVMEVVARLGAAVSKVEVDLPPPEPVVVPTLEDLLGTSSETSEGTSEAKSEDGSEGTSEAEGPERASGSSDAGPAAGTADPAEEPAVPVTSPPPKRAAPAAKPARGTTRASRGRRAPAGRWARVVSGALIACVAAGVAAFVAVPGVVLQLGETLERGGLLPVATTRAIAVPVAPEAPGEPVPPAAPAAAPAPADPSGAPSTAAADRAQPVVPEEKSLPRVAPAPAPAPALARAAKPAPAPPARRDAPPASRRAPAKPAPPPAPPVRVNFNAAPWAEIVVDGRSLGPTPLADVRLAPGEHELRATFPDGRVVRRTIRVDARNRRFRIR